MPFLQVSTISGQIIENSRFEVDDLSSLKEEHKIQMCFQLKDSGLINWLKSQKEIAGVHIDKIDKEYEITFDFVVMKFIHVYEEKTNRLESQASLKPADRNVEMIYTFLKDKNKCNPKFKEIVKAASS